MSESEDKDKPKTLEDYMKDHKAMQLELDSLKLKLGEERIPPTPSTPPTPTPEPTPPTDPNLDSIARLEKKIQDLQNVETARVREGKLKEIAEYRPDLAVHYKDKSLAELDQTLEILKSQDTPFPIPGEADDTSSEDTIPRALDYTKIKDGKPQWTNAAGEITKSQPTLKGYKYRT